MLLRRSLLAAVSLAALPAAAQSKLKAVATFSILGDLLREIGGERIELAVLVGPDSDAHSYQPTPTDARAIAAAALLASNGLGFEGWIDRLAKAAPFKGRAVVASAGVPTLAATPHAGHSHGHSHGHDHGKGPDPHCWHDVALARRYVATLTQGLAAADPANAAFYRERATAYDARLADLDSWVKSEFARVPAAKRRAIVSHNSFAYFARAYGATFHAVRGTTGAEPSARDVAALIRQAREQKIKALFVENFGNPAIVTEIARETGATLGPRLYSDALSGPGGPAASYEAMMRHNVRAMIEGMLAN